MPSSDECRVNKALLQSRHMINVAQSQHHPSSFQHCSNLLKYDQLQLIVMDKSMLLAVAVIFGLAAVAETGTRGVFYVTGSEGIHVIDPSAGKVDKFIGPKQVCTESPRTKKKCSFGGAVSIANELVAVSDSPGNRVLLIDVEKQKVRETIPTEPYPYDLYYLHWRGELWVHTWTNATFDVINTKGRLENTHRAIKAHVQPGWTHGYMSANQNMKDGSTAYVTHLWNPGLHQINLGSKAYSDFVNVSSWNCTGTLHFAYSTLNQHGFFECMGAAVLLELDTKTDTVVRKWDIPGYPFASPNGRYVVSLYAPVNETANKLLDSKVYIIEISKESAPVQRGRIDIPGGVSALAFVEKEEKPGSYFVFITLLYADKIAVVDLDLAASDQGSVTYISGVGRVMSGPGMHALSRPIALGGDWIITPATLNNSAAVINVKTRKLHATVKGIVGGHRIAWVGLKESTKSAGPGISQPLKLALLPLAFSLLYI